MRDSIFVNTDMTSYITSNRGRVIMIHNPGVSKIYPASQTEEGIQKYIDACDEAIAELKKRKADANYFYLTGKVR